MVWAQDEPEPADTPAILQIRYLLRNYRDPQGQATAVPSHAYTLSVPVAHRLRVEAMFDTGNSAQVSLSNLDLGLAYRLGNLDEDSQDPFNNLHVALTWSTFQSTTRPGTPMQRDSRDEGLGIGVARLASPTQEVSYYYRLMLHPSLGSQSTNLLGGQAMLLEGGVSVRLNSTFFLDLGYRHRTHKHGGADDVQLSTESGPTLGLKLQF